MVDLFCMWGTLPMIHGEWDQFVWSAKLLPSSFSLGCKVQDSYIKYILHKIRENRRLNQLSPSSSKQILNHWYLQAPAKSSGSVRHRSGRTLCKGPRHPTAKRTSEKLNSRLSFMKTDGCKRKTQDISRPWWNLPIYAPNEEQKQWKPQKPLNLVTAWKIVEAWWQR